MKHLLSKKNTQSGHAMLTATLFFLFIAMVLVMGTAGPILEQVRMSKQLMLSKEGLYASEAGLEDVLYRVKFGVPTSGTEQLVVNNATASTSVGDVLGGKIITARGESARNYRSTQVQIKMGIGAAFHYGVQAGNGGITFENSSTVRGNVYANGPVIGVGNLIRGDVVSAGPNGLIRGIHSTSSAYAHTIQNSTVDKNAYYQVISGSTVLGTSVPASPDQATTSMPISDSSITDWEAVAEAGGIINSPCPYTINTVVSMGPVKINCDLNVGSGGDLTLLGPIWVSGNISFTNTAKVRMPAGATESVPMIADRQTNRTTSSKISILNSTTFYSSGINNSHALLISMNNSSENGGTETAMVGSNNTDTYALMYAPHGEIEISNSISLKEVTAFRIRLRNSAEVIYETGLANMLFSAGPSGGYVITNWKEVE